MVHLFTRRVTVATLRLVLCHLVLGLVAQWDILLLSLESPATSTGFHQPLALELTKHNSRDKDTKAQTSANSDQIYFVGPNKVKPPNMWKCNIDIFLT